MRARSARARRGGRRRLAGRRGVCRDAAGRLRLRAAERARSRLVGAGAARRPASASWAKWWRTVTALTVHLDSITSAGNVAFGAFFGYFVARYLGRGVGWLAILGSADVRQRDERRSCSRRRIARSARRPPFSRRSDFSPPIRGGGASCERRHGARGSRRSSRGSACSRSRAPAGENTDLFAHLLGFVSGFGCGLLLARLGAHRLGSPSAPRAQNVCAGDRRAGARRRLDRGVSCAVGLAVDVRAVQSSTLATHSRKSCSPVIAPASRALNV